MYFEYGALEGLKKFSINNLGDPFIESNYGVHSREFEVCTNAMQDGVCLYALISFLLNHRLESCNGLQSCGRLIVRTSGVTSPTVGLKGICMASLLVEKTIQMVSKPPSFSPSRLHVQVNSAAD